MPHILWSVGWFLLAGFCWWTNQRTSDGRIDFAMFWYAPAAFALVVLLFFMATFWDKSGDESTDENL